MERAMADWENPSNKNAKTLRIGIIPRVVCGASRVRTGDPLLAKQMRYQLRYSPSEKKSGTRAASLFSVGPGGLEPPTSSLSGMRSNQLSYGPDPYASKAHK